MMPAYRSDVDPFSDIRVLPREATQLRHHLSRIHHTMQKKYFVSPELSEFALQPDKSDEFIAHYKEEIHRIFAKINKNAKYQYSVHVDPLRLTTGFEFKRLEDGKASGTSARVSQSFASPDAEAKWTASMVETGRQLAVQQVVESNRMALSAALQSTPASQQVQNLRADGANGGGGGGMAGGALASVVDSDCCGYKAMSLLLDDEEVFVPPMKSTKLDVHVLNSDGDSAGTGKQPADADADLKGDSARANTSPSAATRTAYTPSRSNTAAAAAFIARKGGNGIEKMDALIFGMPKVFVSSGSAAAACQAPRTALALEDTLAASNCTPTTQKARSQASKLNTEGRSSASCNTQPKIVSGARSPSSLSSPSQRQVSVVSFGDSFPASQESTVEAHMAVVSPAKPGASPAASPPARPASKPSPPNSAETTPTQPAKTQMRLSDFFSKMACKR